MALTFLSPIHKATRQLSLHLEGPCTDLGLSTGEAHLLSYLRSYGPCPIAELSRVLGTKPSTLTSLLDRLSGEAFLRRQHHPEDRRSFLVELMPAGRRAAARIEKVLRSLEVQIRARVDKQEVEGFRAVMSAIAQVTQVDVRPPAANTTANTRRDVRPPARNTQRKERR